MVGVYDGVYSFDVGPELFHSPDDCEGLPFASRVVPLGRY